MLLHEPFSDRMSVSLEERKNNLESHEKRSDLCSSNCITSSAREGGGEAELRFELLRGLALVKNTRRAGEQVVLQLT